VFNLDRRRTLTGYLLDEVAIVADAGDTGINKILQHKVAEQLASACFNSALPVERMPSHKKGREIGLHMFSCAFPFCHLEATPRLISFR
jgi:hypothetical protein